VLPLLDLVGRKIS
jgi:hypothetical protein